jgi:hypothetical protein
MVGIFLIVFQFALYSRMVDAKYNLVLIQHFHHFVKSEPDGQLRLDHKASLHIVWSDLHFLADLVAGQLDAGGRGLGHALLQQFNLSAISRQPELFSAEIVAGIGRFDRQS